MKTNFFLKGFVIFTTTLMFSVSCETEKFNATSKDNSVAISSLDQNTMELAYPGLKGEWKTIQVDGQEVQAEEIDDYYIVEGDMLFAKTDIAAKKHSLKGAGRTDRIWPNNIVFFRIDPNLPNRARVTRAIAHWEARTNLTFVERSSQTAYINFRPGSGCSSFVGRTGSSQNVTLGDGCSVGNTIHEIGHAVGLFHEQSRADRDDFVRVLFENITPGRENNFLTWRQRNLDGRDLTPTLDFGSIMMYGPTFFSRNGQPTITRRDGTTYSFQRNGLSRDDIRGIAQLYPQRSRAVPLYRYYRSSRVNHFYTTNFGELGSGKDGYKYEGIQCKILNGKASGTKPLYRYYNPSKINHFYTTNFRELGTGRDGYRFENIAGFIYTSNGSGRNPLYRYYNSSKINHFYTTNFSELGNGRDGYKYEGIAGYVLPN